MTMKMQNLHSSVRERIREKARGKEFYALKAGTTSESLYRNDYLIPEDQLANDVAKAYAECTADQNDTLWLTPEAHVMTAATDFSKDQTHVLGLEQQVGLGHKTELDMVLGVWTPHVTISADYSQFANFKIGHNGADAANLKALVVSGDSNRLTNVQVGCPDAATGAGTAGVLSTEIGGLDNVFDECVFGDCSATRSSAQTALHFIVGATRNVFRKCMVMMDTDDAAAFFAVLKSDLVTGWTYFEDTMFIASSATWGTSLALGFSNGDDHDYHRFIFGPGCCLVGADDVITAAREASAFFVAPAGSNNSVTTAIGIGLPVNPDHTA